MKWEWFLQVGSEISFNSEVSFSYLSWLNTLTNYKIQVCPLPLYQFMEDEENRSFSLILVLPFRSTLSLVLPFFHGNINFQSWLCGSCQSALPTCRSLVSYHCGTSWKKITKTKNKQIKNPSTFHFFFLFNFK